MPGPSFDQQIEIALRFISITNDKMCNGEFGLDDLSEEEREVYLISLAKIKDYLGSQW